MQNPRPLLSRRGINDFCQVLKAYSKANIPLGSFVDGGAGLGHTALIMLPYLEENEKVFAFEPFRPNQRFFETSDYLKQADGRVVLVKKALSDEKREMTLAVHSVVDEDSKLGRAGKTGYSSLGYLIDREPSGQHDETVECTRMDEEIPTDTRIGFIKLDLQGGELNALKGMESKLSETAFMWVEYSGQPGLYEYIFENNFVAFDSHYLFLEEPNEATRYYFDIDNSDLILTTGRQAWTGYRRTRWNNYPKTLDAMKVLFGLVQTDLLCVNRGYWNEFLLAKPFLRS